MAAQKSGIYPTNGAGRSGVYRPEVAKTDVYDERRRTFLIQYPIGVVIALGLAGVLTFALTGFLGYRDENEPHFTQAVFSQAWPLFLWFCALIMALQISVLRHRLLRRQLTATLVVTLLSMAIVGILYYYKVQFLDLLQNLLQQLLNIRLLLPEISGSKWLYAIINFGLILIFWVDTVRRWIRRASGQPIHTTIDISLEGVGTSANNDEEQPSLQELISGDLIAGALLTFVLSLVFKAEIVTALSNILQINVPITSCTVSWPIGACPGLGGGVADPPTLTFIDLIQTLIYLPLGLLILALSATLAGLGAVGGVNEAQLGQQQTAVATQDESSTQSVSVQVSQTIFDTLKSALNRRIRLAAGNTLLSLRNAGWPALILVGVIAAASAARNLRLYLHILSDERTCGASTCAQTLQSYGTPYQYAGLAILWGVVALACIVFSLALLIFNRRIVENTSRFLGLIGFVVLLTLWIFSLALSLFNLLLIQINATQRVPFPQPGVSTIISFGALMVYAVILLTRRFRGEPAATVPVGSRTNTTSTPNEPPS